MRFAHSHLLETFPDLPQRSGRNKRLRAALGLVKRVIRMLARDTDFWLDTVWITDSTPVECGRSRPHREAVERRRLGELRLLREPFPVLLGPVLVAGVHSGWHADLVGSGRSEDRRTRGAHGDVGCRVAGDHRPDGSAADRGQGLLRRVGSRPSWPHEASPCCGRRWNENPRVMARACSSRYASSSSPSTTPSKASSTSNDMVGGSSTASPSASPSASSR